MSITIAIEIDQQTATKLNGLAEQNGLTPAAAAAEAVRDHLEQALRYRSVLARVETLDEAVCQLASFLGEATAGTGGELDLSTICKAHCQPVVKS